MNDAFSRVLCGSCLGGDRSVAVADEASCANAACRDASSSPDSNGNNLQSTTTPRSSSRSSDTLSFFLFLYLDHCLTQSPNRTFHFVTNLLLSATKVAATSRPWKPLDQPTGCKRQLRLPKPSTCHSIQGCRFPPSKDISMFVVSCRWMAFGKPIAS